jgi:SAM-dependent methyltransferase
MRRPGVREIIEWDVPNWSVALKFWIASSAANLHTAEAMEIGSRHGGLSLWAAGLGMRVLCTDVTSPAAETVALHARFGVADRIHYETMDAVNIPYQGRFDIVLFKSVLGAIGAAGGRGRQAAAIMGIHRSLRPDGELWFAENVTGSPVHQALRRRFVPWGARWRYPSVAEMLEFLSPFSSVRFITVGFLGAFGRSERQRAFLGGLDRLGVDRLVPRRWRYVMIGLARS